MLPSAPVFEPLEVAGSVGAGGGVAGGTTVCFGTVVVTFAAAGCAADLGLVCAICAVLDLDRACF